MGCQSPTSQKENITERGCIAPTSTDRDGRITGCCWILQVSSHHCSSSSKPESPPCQGMNSHLAPVRHVNTGAVPNAGQESLQVASQCHLSQLCPKDCAPSQLWQAGSITPLKAPVNYRPLGWKFLSICQWKLTLMPHKFSGYCPYLFIDLLMSFSPCLKGVGRKRARPWPLWHHSSAVKTNWTFSPPGSPHYIPYLSTDLFNAISCSARHKHHTDH